MALAHCGELWAAVAALSDAIQANHPSPHALLQRGTLLLMLGRAAAALNDLNQALELRPGWPLALHRRAFVHKELQQFKQAAADFEASARSQTDWRVNYYKVYRELLADDAYDDDPEWEVMANQTRDVYGLL